MGKIMGCDIHFYVEKKVNGDWVTADKWSNPYSDEYKDVDSKDEFYGNRNYCLFSILADVRNGYGVAGSDTGDGFIPICKPKGLPEDACKEVKELWKYCPDHTPSWLTLEELLDYDWTQVTTRRGYVTGPVYADWIKWEKENGENPERWCSGGNFKVIEEVEMKEKVGLINSFYQDHVMREKALEDQLGQVYCQISWEQIYSKTCESFWAITIPKLLRLGNPRDVRAVFWFDS